MNDFFDPTADSPDADVISALQTLPEPPAHGADFWSSLETSMDEADADPAGQRRVDPHPGRNGRTQFLLVAAALVIVAGIIGVAVNNGSDEGPITVADSPEVTDGPTPTTEPDAETGTDEAPPPGDRPFMDDGTVFGEVDGYYVDERFGYDLRIPAGFRVEPFSSVYGAYLTSELDPAAASISITHLFAEDPIPDWATAPIDGETLVETSPVERPLFTSINDSVAPAGTFTAGRYEFDRGDLGQRVVQINSIENRVVIVEIVDSGLDVFPGGVDAVLIDAFRFYDHPEYVSDCSSAGLPALSAPVELNAAQAARYESIMTALTTCDLPLLGELVNPAGFSASIVNDPAFELWVRQERFGEPVLRTLYDFLALPVGIDETGEAQWPRGWATIEGPDDETTALLIENGYVTAEEVPSWDEIGYFGWRTGIDAEGNWNYFLVGD